MKILHLLYSGLGGHGNVFFSMVSADIKREFEFEALFYGIEEVRAEFINDCEREKIPWYFAKKTIWLDVKYYYRIMMLIRKSNPDIIFLHGSAYILPAKLAGLFTRKKCKIIIRETQANHLKTKAQWVSLSGAMFLADHIVCLTQEFKSQVKKKLKWLYREKKVRVISNGINLELYKPGEKPQDKTMVIGMQSRIVRIKDHNTLIKAFALLKEEFKSAGFNLKLRIAGDGDLKEGLVVFAKELGLSDDVEFTGMIPEKELVDFLQSLDIYVHASFGETMSTSIMQAMACKLPIIASDVNGINNMITDQQTGLLVPPENIEMLAAAMSLLIRDEQLREAYSDKAYDYAMNNFSNNSMFESYKALF